MASESVEADVGYVCPKVVPLSISKEGKPSLEPVLEETESTVPTTSTSSSAATSSVPSSDQDSAFQSIEILKELQVVEVALQKSQLLYERVKNANFIFNWSLGFAETMTAVIIEKARPYASKFEPQAKSLDAIISKTLLKIEEKLPVLKESPEQIYETAVNNAREAVKPVKEYITLFNNYRDLMVQAFIKYWKLVVKMVAYFDKLLKDLEKYLDRASAKDTTAPVASPAESSSAEPGLAEASLIRSLRSILSTTVRLAIKTTLLALKMSLVISKWLLNNLPLVGSKLAGPDAASRASSLDSSQTPQLVQPTSPASTLATTVTAAAATTTSTMSVSSTAADETSATARAATCPVAETEAEVGIKESKAS